MPADFCAKKLRLKIFLHISAAEVGVGGRGSLAKCYPTKLFKAGIKVTFAYNYVDISVEYAPFCFIKLSPL